ncbi:sugar porter family MFS transporter [Novipirellula artificiosorum]|uniref:Putative metabolite transport protein CsbC n=1 Tax=Novipirellula artificiosorum TaxID=2528016 RepID=A0A5C6E277_9BACT|nr:sugar porter family MFS transporter [Novipirellula artificiosorum]TWU42077.1 putative metabolite transport protein CsbC [Novipirellula artificiosorum]
MNKRLFFWSLTSALAGFLFGFDTVVISGAEKPIQALWELSSVEHGLAMSMALWGTVVGSLIGGWPTDRFGRTKTLLWIGILYVVSAVWSAMATDVYSFMIARFIGGLGVGISTVAAPLYISEISPPAMRGRLAGMFQFNIVLGILIAFLSNALLGNVGENAWRWMMGVEAFPAIVYSLLCFTLPESPRWLIGRGDRETGLEVLRTINSDASEADVLALADEIVAAATSSERVTHGFWSWKLRTPIMLAFLVAFFNQLSGINAILYFAPRIFGLTGLDQQAALLQSVGIGLTNLIFTFVGLYLIDRLGRKTLLFIGAIGYIVSLGLCSYTFFANASEFKVASTAIEVVGVIEKIEQSPTPDSYAEDLSEAKTAFAASVTDDYRGEPITIREEASVAEWKTIAQQAVTDASEASNPAGMIVLLCIFGFIAAHAVGQGAVIWVLISEIFPNKYRAAGQSLGSFTHWIFAAMLTLVFPWMVTYFAPGYVFGFFCFMMVLELFWVIFLVPETKGVPLEQIQRQLGVE